MSVVGRDSSGGSASETRHGASSDRAFVVLSVAKLLSSGLISALALTAVTSNRWHLLDPQVGIQLVLFLQWQILSLTLTKLGVDQIIFAAITENHARRASTRAHMFQRALPLSFLSGLIVGAIFDSWAGAICFTSLLLDTRSTFILADLNARERYTDVTIASLLNYPLFFFLVFGLQTWFSVELPLVLLLFVATSFARWLWLNLRQIADGDLAVFVCQGTVLTGLAPVLNFLMFRMDQLVLSIGVVGSLVVTVGPDFIRQILFVGRFQELLSGGFTVLTGILLPRLFLAYPLHKRILGQIGQRFWLVIAYLTAVTLALIAYSLLWRGSDLPLLLLVSGALGGALILPANAVTYSMIRQGFLRALVRNLLIAIGAGLIIITISLVAEPLGIATIAALQLGLFVTLAFTAGWLTPQRLYE